MRRLVLFTIAVLLALPIFLIPTSGLAQVDASTYLPPSEEMPPGFELIPDGEQNLSGPQVLAVIREYRRLNLEVAPDDETRLIVGVESTASLVRGLEVYTNTVKSLPSSGWTVQPLYGAIGDQAVIARRPFDLDYPRASEEVQIYFRVNHLIGLAIWADFKDLPNYDLALGVAHQIESRLRDAGTAPVIVPVAPPSRGSAPVPTATPGQGAASTPGPFIPYQGNGGGPTLCRDGMYSHSSGRGTCSGHGGIAR